MLLRKEEMATRNSVANNLNIEESVHGSEDENTPTENRPYERFHRRSHVTQKYGVSTSTIYRWVNAGRFPAPIQLGPGVVAWRDSELLEFDKDPAAWAKQHQAQG